MKDIEIILINNYIYILLNAYSIKNINEIKLINKSENEFYILLDIENKKKKFNLVNYIRKINHIKVDNKVIEKKLKQNQTNIQDLTLLITDKNEFQKLENGLLYEIPLKNYFK